jgi:hypothetical protein
MHAVIYEATLQQTTHRQHQPVSQNNQLDWQFCLWTTSSINIPNQRKMYCNINKLNERKKENLEIKLLKLFCCSCLCWRANDNSEDTNLFIGLFGCFCCLIHWSLCERMEQHP